MSELIRDSRADFFGLVGAASDDTGLDPVLVEKDYWVTELLRSLGKPLEGDQSQTQVVFKGGTSLSKAFGIIERFSEDVDILLVPPEDAGAGRIDGILKRLVARGDEDLGVASGLIASGKGKHRQVSYDYEAHYQSDLIRQGVRLEMGIRGGPEPNKSARITSFIADAATTRDPTVKAADIQPVEILTLAPDRTLVEKLHLLHGASSMVAEDSSKLSAAGRHYYDVHRLLSNDGLRGRLADSGGMVEELASIILGTSEEFFPGPHFPRPDSGYADSPAFSRKGVAFDIASESYTETADLVWGQFPEFTAVLALVEESRSLL